MVQPSFASDRSVSVSVGVVGPVVVVDLAGEIDLATRDAVSEPLFACVAERPPALVVDLTNVQFIASTGLAILIDVTERAARGGTALRIVASTPVVLKPLEVSGLTEVLPVCRTVPEALKDVAGSLNQ